MALLRSDDLDADYRAAFLRLYQDKRCMECGGPNPVWRVSDDMWHEVMRDRAWKVLCPVCFTVEAEAYGIGSRGSWTLVPGSGEHLHHDGYYDQVPYEMHTSAEAEQRDTTAR